MLKLDEASMRVSAKVMLGGDQKILFATEWVLDHFRRYFALIKHILMFL